MNGNETNAGPNREAAEAETGLDLSSERSRSMDPKLLELIVCPITKTTLEFDAVNQELISRAAKLAYPIRDGIPIMLSDEARKLED